MTPEERRRYREQNRLDQDLSGVAPQLITSKDGSTVIVRMELVDHSGQRPQRTGRYVHLGMTAADSMHLLALLSAAQRKHGWPVLVSGVDPPLEVPPAKDQN